jgi:DNA mismatch endonuclease, patch repair protein
MTDVHTSQQRSNNMAAIRSANTRPERLVRSILHRAGFRFRLHRIDLPAKPDIVLPRHNTIILVHGCFWHMHKCKYGMVSPVQNADFWSRKRSANVVRDKKAKNKLKKLGWRVLIVWECWTRDPVRIEDFLTRTLLNNGSGTRAL